MYLVSKSDSWPLINLEIQQNIIIQEVNFIQLVQRYGLIHKFTALNIRQIIIPSSCKIITMNAPKIINTIHIQFTENTQHIKVTYIYYIYTEVYFGYSPNCPLEFIAHFSHYTTCENAIQKESRHSKHDIRMGLL